MTIDNHVKHPMTLAEKILAHQATNLTKPFVEAGDTVIVRVARTLASEITLVGIKSCLAAMGNPALLGDRFFLACDHSVDPQNYSEPVIKERIRMCKEFSEEHGVKDYFGPNESILHTEFYRQKALPGTVIVGADSHSCAHGCVGAFAIGLGAADVTIPLVTGITWLAVPPSILIEFVGELQFGMLGKDVMLHLLRSYKRNSIALDKCIEFGGNICAFDMDDRFAICNMMAEFGAVAGLFPADEITQGFLAKRSSDLSIDDDDAAAAKVFRADRDARYEQRLVCNLSYITEYTVARWPSPDDVFSLDDPALDEPLFDKGKKVCDGIRMLDGCFIGACTTTENEIIFAALLLEVLIEEKNFVPKTREHKPYKRQITPGSRIMAERLEATGILDIYRRAGFTIGAAGCSYCLGLSYDKAKEGEVWLSSQNRNFKNRMGKGAIGSITSAAVVAASSFEMEICKMSLMAEIVQLLKKEIHYKKLASLTEKTCRSCIIDEPRPVVEERNDVARGRRESGSGLGRIVQGRVQRFGDSVDTDAIIPAQFIPLREKEQGEKSFSLAKPDFVELVKKGFSVIVAGEGFGCGSSREEAASCLKFAGVDAVIAKSFSFIYGRNLLTMNLFGFTIKNEKFYELAVDGAEIAIDTDRSTVTVSKDGVKEEFQFSLSPIQQYVYKNEGIMSLYCSKGKDMFQQISRRRSSSCCSGNQEDW